MIPDRDVKVNKVFSALYSIIDLNALSTRNICAGTLWKLICI